eukprot:m.247080 g.247080  ORF g.247080 m.247080 type:complete len:2952 (-) comp33854_c0_seq2:851-9706(-)
MATAKDAEETYLNYGDHCCFKDKNHGYMGSPVTSSHHAHLVVPDKLLEGISFQTHVFQIVAAEKYQQSARLEREMRTSIKKREQEHHQALKEANRKLKEKTKGSAQAVEQMEAEVFEPPHTKELLDNVDPKLLDSAMAEMNDNDLTQSRQFGFRLRYGDVVQLWHPFSRRFVRASTSAVAQLEPSHMKVSLDSRGTSGCQFIVLPRYKIRSVGDAVSNKDEIVFESVKSPGQFLNTSLTTLHSSNHKKSMYPIQNCHEISLSVNRSSFDIEVFSRPSVYSMRQYGATVERYIAPAPPITKHYDDTSVEHYLTAGMVLQLYNKDSESYISAEGSTTNFSTDEPARVSLDAHLRTRKLDERPSRKLAPTSAVTYFQVEKAEGAHVGGTIAWDGAIRLKHVPTQLYLAADESSGIVEGKSESFGMKLVTLNKETDAADSIGFDFDDSAFSSSGDLTVFQMFPEVPAQKNVPIDAYLRLKNKATGCWVHAVSEGLDMGVDRHSENRGDDVDHVDSQSFEGKISKVRWDKAELRHVRLTSEKYNPDAFSIKKVPDELVYHVNMIAGFIPLLHRFAHVRHSRDLNHGEASILAMELDELNQFMYFKGIQQKKRQKLLRSLQVIEVLMEMLKSPFTMHAANAPPEPVTFGFDDSSGPDRPGTDYSHLISSYDAVSSAKNRETKLVVDHVFKVLASFLVGDARKNEMYMCKHVPFLWGMFGTNMSVEPMFNELMRDNIKVIQCVTSVEIKRIVGLMQMENGKNADYLEFLSVLCVCEKDPYREHQASIGQILLVDSKAPPVYLTEVIDNQREGGVSRVITVTTTGNVDDQVLLTDFVKSALDEDDNTSSPEYLFLQRQLELFGNLCLGRMAENIKLITIDRRYLTWEECFLCVQTPSETHETKQRGNTHQLPRSLRTIYVDLIVNLFVDVDPNRDVLSTVELNYPWTQVKRDYYTVAAKNPIQALSGATFAQFPILRQWVFDELSKVESMVHEDRYLGIPQNKLLSSILNLLQHLIKFGYYAEGKDISDLMEPLEGVISGLNDRQRVEGIHQEIEAGDDADDVDEAAAYKEWLGNGRYENNIYGLTVMEAKYTALKCVESLFNHAFNVKLRFMLADFKSSLETSASSVARKPSGRQRKGTEVGASDTMSHHARHTFNTLLAEVKQEDETGRQLSKHLVKDVRKYMGDLARDCNWIMERCDPGWNISHTHISSEPENPTLVQVLLDCSNYEGYYPLLSLSMQLVARIYSANRNLYTKAVQATIMMSEPSSKLGEDITVDVPLLSRESGGVISGESIATCVNVLRYYTASCYVKSHRETVSKADIRYNSDDPGPRHQINQQLLYNTGVLSVIVDVVKTDGQDPLILSAAFEFLRGMACGFRLVQEKLKESLDVLLLTETLIDDNTSSEAHFHLKPWKVALGALVTEIFTGCKETCISVRADQVESILTLLGEYNTDAPTFLDALEAINKVEEYDIPLKRNQELTITNLMLHKKKLVDVAYIDDQSSAVVNEKRLTLLSKGIDEFAQPNPLLRHYHLSLVKLLASTCEGENQQIEATCRSIFTLSELEDTIKHPGIDFLSKAPYLKFFVWVYLNAAASPAETGTETIEADPKSSWLRIMEKLGSEGLEQCYSDDAHALPTHAEFAFDAYVPCLSRILSGHFPTMPTDAVSQAVVSISRSLLIFLNNVFANATGKVHMNKFRVITIVQLLETIRDRLDSAYTSENPQLKKALDDINVQVGGHVLRSEIEDVTDDEYKRTYGEEIRMNEYFNRFATRLGEYYAGANHTGVQMKPVLGYFPNGTLDPGDKDDPESQKYTEDAGADEALPLGPEFQYFSRIFCEKANSTSGHGSTEIETDNVSSLVRLWQGALSFQALADTLERDNNEIVIVAAMQAIRAVCVNEEHMGGKLSHLQSQLVKAKVVLPIATLLGSSNPIVQQEVLAVLTTLLRDGYADSQKAFARYFLGTREETFFLDVTKLIHQSSDAMQEQRDLLKQKEAAENARNNVRETMLTTVAQNTGKQIAELMAEVPNPAYEDDPILSNGGDAGDDLGDIGNIRLVFCVLQSLCEGHNTILQDYLRDQPDNGKSFNLVVLVAEFLPTLTEEFLINKDEKRGKAAAESSVRILIQSFETLIEFAQGNRDNQRHIFNARSIDSVNEIMRKTNGSSGFLDKAVGAMKEPHLAVLLKATSNQAKLDLMCATLVASQLATNDDATKALSKEIASSVDIQALMDKMREYSIVAARVRDLEYEDDISPKQVAFAFYSVIARLMDVTGIVYHKERALLKRDRKWRKRNNAAKKFAIEKRMEDYEKNTGVIEVLMDGTLQKVHFHVEKHWEDQLRPEVREDLLWAVDRSSTADGVRDFADRCKTIIADMKYLDDVQKFSIITRKLLEYKAITNQAVIIVSYLINLVMIMSFTAPLNNYRTIVPAYRDWEGALHEFVLGQANIFTVLSIIHVFLSFTIVITYFLANPPSFRALQTQLLSLVLSEDSLTARENKWVESAAAGESGHKHVDANDSEDEDEDEDESDSDSDSESEDEDAADQLEAQDEEFHSQEVITKIVDHGLISRAVHRTQTSILSNMGLYHLLFLTMSILGMLYYGYFFSFHLFHIIIGSKNMLNVIQSVTKNGRTLVSVMILIILLIYVYALLIFALFRKDIDTLENMFCDDLFQCTITSLRYGLMSGGGLGEAVPTYTNGAGFYNEPAFKFIILDISFFIIVTTIGLNVVFGVIVDTFSELRDEKYRTEELMNSQCFICGRGTYDFERHGKGFRHHVKKEHRMWNYLLFFRHLDEMDPTEYNAIEQHVAQRLFEETYDFFPVDQALCLTDLVTEDAKEDMLLDKMDLLMEEVQDLRTAKDNSSAGGGGGGGGGDDDESRRRHSRSSSAPKSRTATRLKPKVTDGYLDIDSVGNAIDSFEEEEDEQQKHTERLDTKQRSRSASVRSVDVSGVSSDNDVDVDEEVHSDDF